MNRVSSFNRQHPIIFSVGAENVACAWHKWPPSTIGFSGWHGNGRLTEVQCFQLDLGADVAMASGRLLEDCGSFCYNEGAMTAKESSTLTVQTDSGGHAKSIIHKSSLPRGCIRPLWSQARFAPIGAHDQIRKGTLEITSGEYPDFLSRGSERRNALQSLSGPNITDFARKS
jgi:hypothetical protein